MYPAGVSGKGAPLCQHCKERCVKYPPRQLCRNCGVDPVIRVMYRAVRAEYNRQGLGNKGMVYRAEERLLPTGALPGTEEKVRVMEQRLLSGQPLHHPDDARRR
jgi:hypothetical protein